MGSQGIRSRITPIPAPPRGHAGQGQRQEDQGILPDREGYLPAAAGVRALGGVSLFKAEVTR